MGSSIPYLLGLYKTYVKRACENLGVSADGDNAENETPLTEKDYPQEFQKLAKIRKSKPIDDGYENDVSFLKDFSSFDADKYKDLHFTN